MDRSTAVRTLIGAGVGALSLYLTLTYLTDVNRVLRALLDADPLWMAAAGLCEALWFLACVNGWRVTFSLLGEHPSRRWLFTLYTVKLMVNNLLSAGRILGDAVRIYYAARLGWPLRVVVSTVLADLVLGNLGYLLVVLSATALALSSTRVPTALMAVNTAGLIAGVGLWSLMRSERACREVYGSVHGAAESLLRRLGHPVEDVDAFAESTVLVFRSRGAWVALAHYTAGWMARILRLCCVTWAVWPTAPALVPVIMSIAVRGSAVLSVSPAGLGIIEGITAGALATLGIDPSRVVAALLLDRVYATLVPVALGAVGIVLLERRARGE
ncbi:MAG: lysylphosphatidylglycerol synthase transmembrane domain-containing protein [Euryarchaeota archaeon]